MTTPAICPVILAGGSGTRLWPLSRTGFPKQFLCFDGSSSLFQQAVMRLVAISKRLDGVVSPMVVGNEEHRFLILEQLRELGVEPGSLILEPMGRNTAPALTLAALAAMDQMEDPVLVVTPADHAVRDESSFQGALELAISEAKNGRIAILGVAPTHPETGFGYVQVASRDVSGAQAVIRFVEKPDLATAEQYLSGGLHLWNAGMFVLRASVWLDALRQFRPEILNASELAWASRGTDEKFTRPGRKEFESIPAESIDYAVMEQCPGSAFPIHVVQLDAGWSDLGAWDAVWDMLPKDANGNAMKGDVVALDSKNNLVHGGSRLTCLVGVQDLVVVETSDAVLVTNRENAQKVKGLVAELQSLKRSEHVLARKVHRPWGWYDSIDESQRFKVKRIQVKPKASLSLQKHFHRAEHWVVVKGTAEITCGDRITLLTENQSAYIPLGETHRLFNPGTIPLEIIEVQSGGYLGEDDIVRYEDNYGRS
jgi:mannose-1-phosphate guanylyltransferase / mannose-6-phosphate isomerase